MYKKGELMLNMAVKNENNLTPNQQRFADYYLENGCNGTQAYLKSFNTENISTAESRASKLLKYKAIDGYIEKRQKEIQEKTQVTQEYCVMRLKEVVERCMQYESILYFDQVSKSIEQKTELNKDGKEIGVFQFDSAGANKALELLGKTLGIYKDKVETGPDENTKKLDSILRQLSSG